MAMEKNSPRIDVDAHTLVDMMLSIFEGGLIVARMVSDTKVMVKQLTQFKNYIELLFHQV